MKKNNYKNHDESSRWTIRNIASDSTIVLLFACFLAFLKPFGMDNISFVYALGFWVTICMCGYLVYAPALTLGRAALSSIAPNLKAKNVLSLVVSILCASLIMGLITPFIINLFFSLSSDYWDKVPFSTMACLFIGGVITLISVTKTYVVAQNAVITYQQQRLELDQPETTILQQKMLMDFISKLPIEKRGELICLQMDDHYLQVHTDKGGHMLLMRFKDALKQLDGYPGFQTHRSWWVSTNAVAATKREGRRLILLMSNGLEVPVSQTFLSQTKDKLNIS
ncbi:LytTR family DNA-binding domain-containing protein [Pseudoalteromonas luteoviolacea]|uniref:HTH LytTR-type domain-containing protein n=1 Tax=Pseudoalteromonas luteoviolacea S4054 TaxID=1129367 RepID=A0A0F6AIT8_9GAMM|nr:LytTR family DNA-binding domain-containing protein [Pseudoalteromonas luteoviolacea]AOT06408.1 hypothetical protein S4054249_00210 [Pseudoalteromonas luteoviolacea]AOT11325.1 hypothetical protein S40542_00210 [Pseudoalteromonas luteoviolacea]AOT16238.1 hypothetical protein S4054_00210 [Pseudoalteromonas luteoviolacea]KKE85724.1 hypothetical protein N479_24960 [Pseudoalteromonas luteoviolacea S4054]KZN64381.1 hypothetical protein N481_25440 [Pseudoalteromonas luteoviolacea S4047-1]